jgi:hypothetical protein
MAAYLQSGWNIADHLQIILLLICIAMWIDVISSPPPLPDVQKKVATVGFNDDTLTDTEVFQLAIVAEKFKTYLLVTSVHIFILIVKVTLPCGALILELFLLPKLSARGPLAVDYRSFFMLFLS